MMNNNTPKIIIFIHGFSSHGYGGKARALREYYTNRAEAFIAPSLSYIPELAIQTLEELIEACGNDVRLIGSSLGGFYTIYLAQKYRLKAVLINPSIYPYKTLKMSLGTPPNFYDGSHFEWKESHLEMLRKYETNVSHQKDFFLLVQKGDDVLDYREALNKFPNAQTVAEDGGDHSFSGIEHYFDEMENFLLHSDAVK